MTGYLLSLGAVARISFTDSLKEIGEGGGGGGGGGVTEFLLTKQLNNHLISSPTKILLASQHQPLRWSFD